MNENKLLTNNVASSEIEKNILAILLNSPTAGEEIFTKVKQEDFSLLAHQIIFTALFNLYQKNSSTVDLHLLADHLENNNQLKKIGGNKYLSDLMLLFVSETLLPQYLPILLKNSVKNKLEKKIKSWEEFLLLKKDPYKAITFIHQELDSLEDFYHRDKEKFEFLSDAVDKTVKIWEDFRFLPSSIHCTTGFAILDNKTNGFQKGDLIILAARPSMGKTALLLNMAINNTISAQGKSHEEGDIIIFSLEMSTSQLVQRILRSSIANFNLQKIDSKVFTDIKNFSQKMVNSNLFIDSSMTLDVIQIHFKLRAWAKKRKIKLVILDYLQLLKPLSRRFENRNLEVSYWTRQLKEIARELNIPILCASQLSRYVEKREEKRPLLADLRDSGSIEQDADLVLFLYREHYYQKKVLNLEKEADKKTDALEPHEAEVIIAKHRNGPTGIIKLVFVPQKTSFYELMT